MKPRLPQVYKKVFSSQPWSFSYLCLMKQYMQAS